MQNCTIDPAEFRVSSNAAARDKYVKIRFEFDCSISQPGNVHNADPESLLHLHTSTHTHDALRLQLHSRLLVDSYPQGQLRLVAALAYGRIPDACNIPLDRLVRQFEGEGGDEHRQHDLCTCKEVIRR